MRDIYFDEFVTCFESRFPGFDPSTMRMIGALSNTYHILLSVLERAFSNYRLTPQSIDVLVALYVKQEQGCLLGEIGELLMVSPANVTGLVEGLVKKGLVTRKEHPSDRRKRLAEITPEGKALIERFVPEAANFLQEVFAPLTVEDKRELWQRLGKVAELIFPYWEKR